MPIILKYTDDNINDLVLNLDKQDMEDIFKALEISCRVMVDNPQRERISKLYMFMHALKLNKNKHEN